MPAISRSHFAAIWAAYTTAGPATYCVSESTTNQSTIQTAVRSTNIITNEPTIRLPVRKTIRAARCGAFVSADSPAFVGSIARPQFTTDIAALASTKFSAKFSAHKSTY